MHNLKFGVILTSSIRQPGLVPSKSSTDKNSFPALPDFGGQDFEELWFVDSLLAETKEERSDHHKMMPLIRNAIGEAQPGAIGLGILPPWSEDLASNTERLISEFELEDSSKRQITLALAAQVSPESVQKAATLNYGLLSVGATTPGGFNALATHWEIYSRKAKESGYIAERGNWALVAPMHLAETRSQAIDQVHAGIDKDRHLYAEMGLTPSPLKGSELIETLIENGTAVIGTPDDAITQIKRLMDQTGGFGKLLLPVQNWANASDTYQSYKLFSESVIPEFRSTGQS